MSVAFWIGDSAGTSEPAHEWAADGKVGSGNLAVDANPDVGAIENPSIRFGKQIRPESFLQLDGVIPIARYERAEQSFAEDRDRSRIKMNLEINEMRLSIVTEQDVFGLFEIDISHAMF